MTDSDSRRSWCLPFGGRVSKGQVVFCTQATAAFLVIITCIVNLTVPGLCTDSEQRNYWKIALASTIGYLFPNPTLAPSPQTGISS